MITAPAPQGAICAHTCTSTQTVCSSSRTSSSVVLNKLVRRCSRGTGRRHQHVGGSALASSGGRGGGVEDCRMRGRVAGTQPGNKRELEHRPQWAHRSGMSVASSVRSSELDTQQAVGEDDQASDPDQASSDALEGSSNPSMLPIISPGGRRVVEFVAAWDMLADHLGPKGLDKGADAELILAALKLSLPALQASKGAEGQRRALALASTLADLGMDAESVAVGLLSEVVAEELIPLSEVAPLMGMQVLELLHDHLRVKSIPRRADMYDDDAADSLRKFCLAFHDIRAVVVELASRLDTLRNMEQLRPFERPIIALETMQIYAPMAHALRVEGLREELEDLAFAELFPATYSNLSSWMRHKSVMHEVVLQAAVAQLTQALHTDEALMQLSGPNSVRVLARRKSLYSTMRKLVSDGRSKQQVHDLLGLRVIVSPAEGSPAAAATEAGERAAEAACYRCQAVAHHFWRPVEGRSKDYIAAPKLNGYRSLHSTCTMGGGEGWQEVEEGIAADLRLDREELQQIRIELQVRTAAMNVRAEYGSAAHAAYKGGLTDPQALTDLQALMESAEEEAAERYSGLSVPSLQLEGAEPEVDKEALDRLCILWSQFDKSGTGSVEVAELRRVMEDLGAVDAGNMEVEELMALVDLDCDGRITEAEFQCFRSRLSLLLQLPKTDAATWEELALCLPEQQQQQQQTSILTAISSPDVQVSCALPSAADVAGEQVAADVASVGQLEASTAAETIATEAARSSTAVGEA
eukprot:CAMPEP_0118934456 /NCGR_PEP_ID=MMETSP1169-20130426/13834_1 /TAXON_ID=36882 /ORGANISM="Pyramimonas obovata, Strain CCMP722" /LENGTH=753 /DNA_ID=CAMNT_0006877361 /DNA_START=174 /DNA_END=2432 /DNA_ORIENTATION=+